MYKQHILDRDSDHRCQNSNSDEANDASSISVGYQIYYKLVGISDTKITGEMRGWSAMSKLLQYQQQQQQEQDKVSTTVGTNLCNDDESLLPLHLPPMLLISSDDDTIDHRDYIKLQQHYDEQDKQEQPEAGERKQNDDGILQIVILSGGAGHGPFFGSNATKYFQHIQTFLARRTNSKTKHTKQYN